MDRVFPSLSRRRRSRRLGAKKSLLHLVETRASHKCSLKALNFIASDWGVGVSSFGPFGTWVWTAEARPSVSVRDGKANCAISYHRTMEIGLQLIGELPRRSFDNVKFWLQTWVSSKAFWLQYLTGCCRDFLI